MTEREIFMNYAGIKKMDVANGPGLRVTLFVSGCTHHCKGCFNKETWDFGYGEPFTEETENLLFQYLDNKHIAGLTLLGGEPLEPANQKVLAPFIEKVKERFPNKSIWCFTGYDFEKDVLGNMIDKWESTKKMLSYIDILVDGQFKEELKDLNLRFKGSSNQRTIIVKDSMEQGRTILREE